MNSSDRTSAREALLQTTSHTQPVFPLPSPPESPLQLTISRLKKQRLVDTPSFGRPTMPQLIHSYMPRTPPAQPTPWLPSTSVVGTMDIVMTSFPLRARSWLLLASPRAARYPVLPTSPLFLTKYFLLYVLFEKYILNFLPPIAPEVLVSRGGFGSPTSRWLAQFIHPR